MIATMEPRATILNDLPEQHVSVFEAFSRLCTDKGLLSRPSGLADDEVQDGLNDETALLRFLRARRFDPHRAFKQFQDAVIAHETNHVSQLYNEIDATSFETARVLYPHWSGRRTKAGRPICLFDFAHLSWSTLTEYERSRGADASGSRPVAAITTVQRACMVHDSLTRFVFPLCTAMQDRPNPTTPIFSAVYVVDASSFTLKQGWDIKNYTQDISNLLTMAYPEIIDRLFVLNAPTYFTMMWSIIRKWLDPGTADKVVILTASDVLPSLTKYIDLQNIPSKFGGRFDWTHGMGLDVDRGIKEALEWSGEKGLPPGPMKWVVDEAGRKVVVAVGSVDGIPRMDKIAKLKGVEADLEKRVELDTAQSIEVGVN